MAEKKPVVATTSSKKGGVRVTSCSCPNTFQDSLYGAGQRVFGIATKKKEGDKCTSCGRRKN